jgi:GT2 family glycosyltransferase
VPGVPDLDVDVVVVSYNSAGELRDCVEPIARMAGAHVTVVDSASHDAGLETVADLPVATVPLPENRGFAYGCNAGWPLGSAPHVLLLNPDARIDAVALERLADALSSDPAVGAVAPRITEPDGTLDFSLRRFPRLRSTFSQALFLHRILPRAAWVDEVIRDTSVYERDGRVDWASGACLLIRRDVLERLAGLDDGFFLYCEELDLCRRMRDAGLEVRFVRDAGAVHAGGASAPRAALLPVLAASRVRYAHKHSAPPRALAERIGVIWGALTHAAVGRGGAVTRRGWLSAARRAASPRPRPGV